MPQQTATIVPVAIRLRRTLDQPPSVIFDAYRDPHRRAAWLPGPDEVIVVESLDFRVGGIDRFIYQSRNKHSLSGTIRYEQIIDDVSLAYTRRLADAADRTLTLSVVSWTFAPHESGTDLTFAEQTTSLVGSAPIEGCKYRAMTMLDRLAMHVGSR